MKNTTLIIAFSLFCICIGKSQPAEYQSSALARAGTMYVSEQEFLERYELLPGQFRNRTNNTEESKLVFLYSLVAEKLLTQEALARHVDQDSGYLVAIAGIKKMLARDQLYREEISGKVTVSKDEVQSAIVDAKRQLYLSFLYFEDSTDAAFVRKQLKNCRQFNRFQIDTTMAVLRDTATLFWGEAEAPIEQVAFRLKKGECSPVVKASTGYYILHINKELPNAEYNSMQPHVLFERVETKLRLRKEKVQLDAYLENILKTKIGFSLPQPFKMLAMALTDAWKDEPPASEKMVTDSLLEVLSVRCRSILQDSMVVVGSSFWSVEEVLSRLRGKIFKIDPRRTTGIAAQLNTHLFILVGQELLAEEALSRKLDERWSVSKELDMWRQQILAKYEEMDVERNVQVSDQDVFQYASETNPDMQYPRVQIRELHTKDARAMEQALEEVRAGASFESVIRKLSSDTMSARIGGLSDEFGINTRSPLGMLAWRMQLGERQGPVKIKDEYIYVELIKKELPARMTDSAFISSMKAAASAARRLKQKNTLDSFIAKSAQQRGFDIYADRLKLLRVNTAPMMTYRILGFGGRMFAAPFVTRQVDWINIENPERIPVP
jgi:parvulin-like peptidyl-prolyl isomerase